MTRSTSSFFPVSQVQPEKAASCVVEKRRSSWGVSNSGSTLMETKRTSRPKRSPSARRTAFMRRVRSGQASVQRVKMKFTTTTLPWRTSE